MRVLLVDDHPIVQTVLGALARDALDGADVLPAGTLHEALELAQHTDALDLVLLDPGLPGYTGLDALFAFREAFPDPRVVVVSATEEAAWVREALNAGAAGYVPKTHPHALIAAALRVVAAGGKYFPSYVAPDDAFERPAGADPQRLTKRQVDVLRLIAKGFANKQIARRLRIATDTVKQHAKAIYAALGIDSRHDAGKAAERRGIKLD